MRHDIFSFAFGVVVMFLTMLICFLFDATAFTTGAMAGVSIRPAIEFYDRIAR